MTVRRAFASRSIRDGQLGLRGRRVVSRRHQFVEVGRDQTVVDAGHAPYLDYRPASTDERAQLESLVGEPWLSVSLATVSRNHAMAEMAGPHFAEIKRVTDERVARVRAAVEKRLAGQIAYWDQRAEELKALELKGKKPRINSGRARQRADDLEARLESRRRELDLEAGCQHGTGRVGAGGPPPPSLRIHSLVRGQFASRAVQQRLYQPGGHRRAPSSPFPLGR